MKKPFGWAVQLPINQHAPLLLPWMTNSLHRQGLTFVTASAVVHFEASVDQRYIDQNYSFLSGSAPCPLSSSTVIHNDPHSLPLHSSFFFLTNHWGRELTVDRTTGRKLDCSLSLTYRKDFCKLLKREWKKWKGICTPGRLCHRRSLLNPLLTGSNGTLREHRCFYQSKNRSG